MPSPRRAGIICTAALAAGAACSWGKSSRAHQTTNEEARQLVAAVTSGDVMRAESLLSSGINPNVRAKRQGDDLGPPSLPALDVAIGRGNQQMVQILLEHGANPNSVSSTDIVLDPTFTPLTRAIDKGLADIVQLLDPEVLVVGGGVIDAGELLLGPTREAYREQLAARGTLPVADVVGASMGNLAGVVGAADLARR